MGIVGTLPMEMTSSHQMINTIRQICPSVDDYLTRELYLIEVPSEGVTTEFLLRKCYELICDELSELGIVILDLAKDELSNDSLMQQCAIFLRKKFDAERFRELIQYDPDLIESIHEICNNVDYELEEFELGNDIIELFDDRFPLDEGWSFLVERTKYFRYNSSFLEHIEAILNTITKLGPIDVFHGGNITAMEATIDKIKVSIADLNKFLTTLAAQYDARDSSYARYLASEAYSNILTEPWLTQISNEGFEVTLAKYKKTDPVFPEYWKQHPERDMTFDELLVVAAMAGCSKPEEIEDLLKDLPLHQKAVLKEYTAGWKPIEEGEV